MFRINREVRTRPEIKEKIIFDDAAINKIFKNLDEKNINFRLTIFLLFYTGLRSSDILNIKQNRIDLNNRILNYYSPKRKKFREVPFHEDLLQILKVKIENPCNDRLLDYASVENLGKAVKRYLTKLELDNKYSARTFRKTFITLCRSRYNIDASVVREPVGHEHGNTTDRYYNQIDMVHLKEGLKKFKKPIIQSNTKVED
jgi:integrase